MATLGDLIDAVRFNTNDNAPDRAQYVSDGQIVHYLNESISDVSRDSEWFTENKLIKISNQTINLDLSNIAVKLLRVEHRNRVVRKVSRSQMDFNRQGWIDDTGDTIQFVVVEDNAPSKFRLYPIPENLPNEVTEEVNQTWGLTRSVEFSDLTGPFEITNEAFGLLDEVEQGAYINIFYVKRFELFNAVTTPAETTAGTTYRDRDLGMRSDFMFMLANLISARIFSGSDEESDKARASEQFALYNKKLRKFNEAKATSTADLSLDIPYNPWSLNRKAIEADYNRPFNRSFTRRSS